MADSHTGLLFSNDTERTIVTDNSLDKSHEHKFEQKNTETQECILYGSIYLKFRDRKTIFQDNDYLWEGLVMTEVGMGGWLLGCSIVIQCSISLAGC